MIIYGYDCAVGARCEPQYFFNYGAMVFHLIMAGYQQPTTPTDETFTPFNDYIQAAFTTTDADEEQDFFKFLTPYSSQIMTHWPLPIYGTAGAADRKLLIEFLCHYLFPKYWESYLLPPGKEETDAERGKVWRRFFDRFIQLLAATYWKYIPIIKAFKTKEAGLLARLESTTESITRFNDTPQEGGDFADEDHATTATTGEITTGSDYETPINRLREIREKWENIYNAWAMDFDILFTKGGSLEDE